MSLRDDNNSNLKKGQPLCPFCGKPEVYPLKEKKLFLFEKTVAWSCANEKCRMYRKRFPSPSWGAKYPR